MKKVLILYEGAADEPLEALNRRTPLAVARCSVATRLARAGCAGRLPGPAEGEETRTGRTLGRMLGVSADRAKTFFQGPLEALGVDLEHASFSFVYRGNFVTFDHDVITDSRAARLSESESQSLVEALNERWEKEGFHLMCTGPARFLVLTQSEAGSFRGGLPPSVLVKENLEEFLPGAGARSVIRDLLELSRSLLESHPVNEVRVDLGENPANGIWLWGGGPPIKPLNTAEAQRVVLFSPSRLVKGLARAAGFRYLEMDDPWMAEEGAVPSFRIAQIAHALRESDLLVVYIEAPGEQGYYGETAADKVRALEVLDQFMLEPLLGLLEAYKPFVVLLTSDGVSSSREEKPVSGVVPFILAAGNSEPDGVSHWDEKACEAGSLGLVKTEDVLGLLERNV